MTQNEDWRSKPRGPRMKYARDEDGRLRVGIYRDDPHDDRSFEYLYDPDGVMVAKLVARDWSHPNTYFVRYGKGGEVEALVFPAGGDRTTGFTRRNDSHAPGYLRSNWNAKLKGPAHGQVPGTGCRNAPRATLED